MTFESSAAPNNKELNLIFTISQIPYFQQTRTFFMQVARVIGTVTSSFKHDSLVGAKLLLVQPLLADGEGFDGDPQVAIDTVSAGIHDRVVITSDGRLMRDVLNSKRTPARWSTIALVD
jgi:microcompartment protein CcmK/EutM